ncbi:MAG: carbohydrate-binding domain-containing protein [Prevotella sp.]|nr:carbohydrate-binding domain-containing protein [Staphylococcus sp.]MCM1350801.1 carbohydrate-binding domain-containing protein [Prevotella sp.]
MEKMFRKIVYLALIVFMGIGLVGCKMNQENPDFDHLGGGQTGEKSDLSTIQKDSLVNLEKVLHPSEELLDTSTTDAIQIDLSKLVENENTDYYTYQEDVFTIIKDGVYMFTSTFCGAISISGKPSYVRIILNNVTIETKDNQAQAPLVFAKNDGMRILTVQENTLNYLSDSSADTKIDGDSAIIQAKKSSLVINGKGKLILNAKGEDTTGLKVKKELDIFGTTIHMNVPNNGIKADERINLTDATLEINALGDGIKTGIEAETEEEKDIYTKDPYQGYIYIHNTGMKIVSGDDGISANSFLYIENDDDIVIDITTNTGAPDIITEYSSDHADGKAIKVDGIEYVTDTTKIDLVSQCEHNYMLVIDGGKYIINSNSDAISSKGNLIIQSGTFEIESGDDGIHAEYVSKIVSGDITISKCYEGIEGAKVEIYGGRIDIISRDDALNAANKDLSQYDFNIYIGGGNIQIDALGDGIDSNGTIEFAGGITIVHGPVSNGDAAIDADRGILINGGIVIAMGSSGMVETPSKNSEQCFVSYNLSNMVSANTKVQIQNESSDILFETISKKQFQSLIVSLPDFILQHTYTITVGANNQSVTLTNILNQIGKAVGPNRPGGGFGGPRY